MKILYVSIASLPCLSPDLQLMTSLLALAVLLSEEQTREDSLLHMIKHSVIFLNNASVIVWNSGYVGALRERKPYSAMLSSHT